MARGSDSNDTSYNRSPSPGSQPGSSDDAKKVMRREKNRIAAQKSRMRQTQKADMLHLSQDKVGRVRDGSAEFKHSSHPVLGMLDEGEWGARGHDNLPLLVESEDLQKVNAALMREVKRLTEEKRHLTSVLSSHEPLCSAVLGSHAPDSLGFPGPAQHAGGYPHLVHPHHPQPHHHHPHPQHQQQQHLAAGSHYQL